MGGSVHDELSDGPTAPPLAAAGSGGPARTGNEGAAPRPIGVVAADDSYMIREFLASVLGAAPQVRLLAACADGDELERAIEAHAPDVVLTDIRMSPSGEEGLQVAGRLRVTDPSVGVVVLSQYAEPAYALSLLGDGTGGRAYLLKERIRDKQELIDAIEAVARGGSVIDPRIVDLLIAARARAANSLVARLTPREQELLAEIAAGKSNGAIAESLVLTKRAVEKHVNAIFSKLDLPESGGVSRRVRAALIFLAEEGMQEER
ncbi:MAG TPA: response regulator transcription factor [Solirubrobacteraceae bacterium]|nr:response regulator transcription factor [Solirubrobacteraceae bacterium]